MALALPETRPARAARWAPAADYLRLVTDARFVGYALSGGVALGGMLAYIAGSPFVFIELYGVSPAAYGWLFGLNSLGLIAAAQLNRRLLDSWSTDEILSGANVANAVAGLALAGAAAVPGIPLAILSIPLFAFMATLGFTQPNALAGVMAACSLIALLAQRFLVHRRGSR